MRFLKYHLLIKIVCSFLILLKINLFICKPVITMTVLLFHLFTMTSICFLDSFVLIENAYQRFVFLRGCRVIFKQNHCSWCSIKRERVEIRNEISGNEDVNKNI